MSRTSSTYSFHTNGVCSKQGTPSYQHDRYVIDSKNQSSIYAVLDGHGSAEHGHLVSQHISQNLVSLLSQHGIWSLSSKQLQHINQLEDTINGNDIISKSFEKLIKQLDQSSINITAARRVYAGSTFNAVFICNNILWCINVGDSRAIIISDDGNTEALSRDHACTDPIERKRIEQAGGTVEGSLLNGYISMSRAIGDQDLKDHRHLTKFPIGGISSKYKDTLFISKPDIYRQHIKLNDIAIVIASDGIWNKLSNQIVSSILMKALTTTTDGNEIANIIVEKALRKGSRDNVTALVILLKSTQELESLFQSGIISKRQRLRQRFSDHKLSHLTSASLNQSQSDLENITDPSDSMDHQTSQDSDIDFLQESGYISQSQILKVSNDSISNTEKQSTIIPGRQKRYLWFKKNKNTNN